MVDKEGTVGGVRQSVLRPWMDADASNECDCIGREGWPVWMRGWERKSA